MRTAILIVVAALALACVPAAPRAPLELTVLTANVGNSLLACEGYLYKLCHVDVERRLAESLAAQNADLVFLQEVIGHEQCAGLDEQDPSYTCHSAHVAEEPSQARRLLGDDYEIACDTRRGYECVGVKRSFGALVDDVLETPPVPEGCDEGFSVSAVTVVPHEGEPFRAVNGHPQSGFVYECRARQIEQLFELAGEARAVVAGDMNLDPWLDNDESILAWDEHVGDDGQRFAYCSGPNEHDPPYPTTRNPLFTATIDHVVSDFLEGSCTTLGEAPGSARLDGGEGMDHRAIACSLAER